MIRSLHSQTSAQNLNFRRIAWVNVEEPVCSAPATWKFGSLGRHKPHDDVSTRRVKLRVGARCARILFLDVAVLTGNFVGEHAPKTAGEIDRDMA